MINRESSGKKGVEEFFNQLQNKDFLDHKQADRK